MTVTSKPLPKAEERAPKRNNKPIAVASVSIGTILWPLGARYSIDGVFWLVNAVLSFLRIPIALNTPPHWAFYLILIPLPYICSRVEWQPPIYRKDGVWKVSAANIVVVWSLVALYDLGTTYLGMSTPNASNAPVSAEIAASTVISSLLAVALTFGPEWLIRSGYRELGKG